MKTLLIIVICGRVYFGPCILKTWIQHYTMPIKFTLVSYHLDITRMGHMAMSSFICKFMKVKCMYYMAQHSYIGNNNVFKGIG